MSTSTQQARTRSAPQPCVGRLRWHSTHRLVVLLLTVACGSKTGLTSAPTEGQSGSDGADLGAGGGSVDPVDASSGVAGSGAAGGGANPTEPPSIPPSPPAPVRCTSGGGSFALTSCHVGPARCSDGRTYSFDCNRTDDEVACTCHSDSGDTEHAFTVGVDFNLGQYCSNDGYAGCGFSIDFP